MPAQLIEIVNVQEAPQSLPEPPLFPEPPRLLMGPALRAALPVPQGPMIPPTLAYITQHRAEAAEHERALQALALERDNALTHEQESAAEVDALKADPSAAQTNGPIRPIHAAEAPRPKAKFPRHERDSGSMRVSDSDRIAVKAVSNGSAEGAAAYHWAARSMSGFCSEVGRLAITRPSTMVAR